MERESQTEHRAIDDLLSAYVAAWREDDMDAWGRLFTDDSDFVTHTGLWWRSRHESVAGHKAVPAEVSRQKARYELRAVETSFLAPEIALVHAIWEWPGFVESAGEAPADRSGIITMVMVNRDRGWLIRASHNTRIS